MSQDNSVENPNQSDERTKMGSNSSSSTNRVRANPKHFLTWSATMANNRIQKLSKNFVNNVSKLQSKMERVMPTFHPPPPSSTSSSSQQQYSEQVENDLSEPNKDYPHHQIHESCRVSRIHKIPLSSAKGLNCEKNEWKTGSGVSEGLSFPGGASASSAPEDCCDDNEGEEDDDDDDDDTNEERYSGFTPSISSYRAQLQQAKDILSNTSSSGGGDINSAGVVVVKTANNISKMGSTSSSSSVGGGEITTASSSPGLFPHQIQSARIVQSQPFKAEIASTKSLVQSGHYKIPLNPTITAEALKQMIINSPTELNSCRKFEDKPQPIKYVEVDTNTSAPSNMLELRSLPEHQHENQSKYNLSCGSSNSNGTTTSNNASLSDNSSNGGSCAPLRNTTNNINTISSPHWSSRTTSSVSTYSSTNPAHNHHQHHIQKMPTTSILKNTLTNAENDYDKRNNTTIASNNGSSILMGRRPPSLNGSLSSSSNIEEISSHGIDNEGLTLTEQQKPSATVSFSSPVIESSSDKQSLLLKGKKSFTKRSKSNNKNCLGSNNSNNNNNNNSNDSGKRTVQFQNPLSAPSPRKHISPGAYPPSQLTVTIFEEESELRHAPWFQAGIPRDIALEVLRNEPIGSFIVRESTTKAGCFALSLRVPKEFKRLGIAHYLILKSGRGYKIKGFTKEFKSLNSLITHHSVMPELLPCPLSLHRYRPNHPQKISRFNSSDFMEPEKLVGFTNFVDCLENS